MFGRFKLSRRPRQLFAAQIIIAALVFAMLPSSATAAELVFTHARFPPYIWRDEQNATRGIFADMMRAVFGRLGVSVVFRQEQWQQAQQLVRDGAADAFITVPTAARRAFANAGEVPWYVEEVVAFAAADNAHRQTLAQAKHLSELRGFLQINYRGNSWARENLQELGAIRWLDESAKVMAALAVDKEAIYIHTTASPLFDRAQLGLHDAVVIATPTLLTADFHLFIGKHSPYLPLLAETDKIAAAMKKSGEWFTFTDKYLH